MLVYIVFCFVVFVSLTPLSVYLRGIETYLDKRRRGERYIRKSSIDDVWRDPVRQDICVP